MNVQAQNERQERRGREIAAKRRVEEAEQAHRLAQNRVRAIASDMSRLQADRSNTAETGHRGVDLLRDGAEATFQARLKDYIGQLRLVEAEAADPPPPELIAAFVVARLGGEFFAALHAAVDAAVVDASVGAYSGGVTVAEVEAKVAAKREERDAAQKHVEEAELELGQAKAAHREAQTEGR